MRLLQSLRGGRDPSRADFPLDDGPVVDAPEGEEHLNDTHVLGARQERFSTDLALIGELAAHLEQLKPMVEQLHQPLMAEFEAHRRDHSELLSVKTHNVTLGASLRVVRESEQGLNRKLAEALKLNEDAQQELDDLRKALAQALAEGGRHRDELIASKDAAEDMKMSLSASIANVGQLEEDIASLRSRLTQGAERRRELDALSAKAQQDADLSEAENNALRHRVEDLTDQLSRLSRSEAQAQAETAAEKERAAALLAEAERAQREAVGHAQAFEAQLSVARTQATSLSTRLDAATARNTKLERLCADLSAKANDAVQHRQTLEGAAGDTQTALDRALERIDQLERAGSDQKSAHTALDRARLTALERGDQLASTLHAEEAALARAEERTRMLEESLQSIARDEEQLRRHHEDETARLAGEIRRLETEVQMSQAALKAAREHRAYAANR